VADEADDSSHPEVVPLPVTAPSRLRGALTKLVAGTAALTCLLAATVAHAEPTGIDVSRWQHEASINWDKVRADGVTFAFIKATEGTNYVNEYFAGDWAGTRRNGIYRGAYHFARPSVGSAARQARYFVRHAGTFDFAGDLPPVLDLESDGGLGVAALKRWTRTWLTTVHDLTGRTPIIYTGPYFWESELGNTTGFRSYPLWVAHYSTSSPMVPGGWSRWTFWQRTSTGRIDGIRGAVDINRFNGTRAQLAALAQAKLPDGNTGGEPGTGTTPDPGPGEAPGTGTPTDPTQPTEPPAPAKTATAVSLQLGPAEVYTGQSVEFSGVLRASGAALAGRPVQLYRRADGARTWTRIASPTTSATGRYEVSFAASASASFRAVYAGNSTYATSASRVADLTVRERIATTSTLDFDRTARRGSAFKAYGHLRTRAGRAVLGRTVHVIQRLEGSSRWTVVGSGETLSPTGWFQAYVTPRRGATYRAVFRGSTLFARSVSSRTTLGSR
jgi:GH25 family lysozyme M1 (1,4-beta-N-acetylmuramidase)